MDMKWTHRYEMLETRFPPHHRFHDDQYSDKEVQVKEFKWKFLFNDFRVFNGWTLEGMDNALTMIVEIFENLAKNAENTQYE